MLLGQGLIYLQGNKFPVVIISWSNFFSLHSPLLCPPTSTGTQASSTLRSSQRPEMADLPKQSVCITQVLVESISFIEKQLSIIRLGYEEIQPFSNYATKGATQRVILNYPVHLILIKFAMVPRNVSKVLQCLNNRRFRSTSMCLHWAKDIFESGQIFSA